MKNVLLMSTIALFLAIGVHAAQGIYGTWQAPVMSGGGMDFNVTMTFTADSMTATNVCTMGGNSATAHVTVPASYTATTVSVNSTAQDTETANGVTCDISVAQSTMNYSVSADDQWLTISLPGQPATTVHRK